ncbi:hypothetical protein [Bordetella avium]|uniref:Uncharacterized protein n=1 Tax=Bordetella avium (strain 197N) TaxID=360910 RepID=Q2L0V2_BORA1|nr:hypothetical protein [Bordetella avium]CAJ49419.1 hypothetical protein BAV1810A [Bordetella avium 197N]
MIRCLTHTPASPLDLEPGDLPAEPDSDTPRKNRPLAQGLL